MLKPEGLRSFSRSGTFSACTCLKKRAVDGPLRLLPAVFLMISVKTAFNMAPSPPFGLPKAWGRPSHPAQDGFFQAGHAPVTEEKMLVTWLTSLRCFDSLEVIDGHGVEVAFGKDDGVLFQAEQEVPAVIPAQ